MSDAAAAIAAIERLTVPQGPLAGQWVRLGAFQRQFIEGALADGVSLAALSVGRGAAKTATAAALGVTHLAGHWGAEPRREIVAAARTRQQAAILWGFARAFAEAMPELQGRLTVRQHPTLELEVAAPDGPHVFRAIASTAKAALGGAPTLAIGDERAAWMDSRGAELQAALETGLAKRDGRLLLLSTSAPSDAHEFSRLLDNPPPGAYVQQHVAPDLACAPDDVAAILAANPGLAERPPVGPPLARLIAAARQAAARGGSALAHYRNLHLNQRVNTEARAVLIELDAWLRCEVDVLPPRAGPVIVGLDAGGSLSMSAAVFYWPETMRLEALGWFGSDPDLATRGLNDGVGRRYVDMVERGELRTLGARVVPVAGWIGEVLAHVAGSPIHAILADRYRAAELSDALAANDCRAPVIWRGQGWFHSGPDTEGFRKMVLDRRVAAPRSLLLRSALSEAVTLTDPTGAQKIAKARSTARVDAAAAAILALAEGYRLGTRAARTVRIPVWA